MKINKKINRIIAGSLSLVMVSSMASVFPTFAEATESADFIYDNYSVAYNVTDSWGNTEVVNITLTNTGDEAIENWMMYFEPNGEIQYINHAEQKTTSNGITYFKNGGYNADIAPSASVSFTYAVNDCEAVPTDFILCQTRKTIESDYTVSLQVNESWGENNEYFNGNIVIQNNSEKPLEDYELTFDTNFTITEITSSWSGTMTALEPYSYMLKDSYINVIAPNSSVNLGFSGVRNGTSEIVDYSLTEVTANEELINFLYLSNFGNWENMPDTDEDGLPDKFEIFIGTDPDTQDSDDDNLPDGYELMTLGSDPTDVYSLDSIFSDGEYDSDNDDLSNYNEYLLGTNPLNIDSDYDNLPDGDEVNIYSTDPTNPDTDSDTLFDGDEIALSLNPLVPDSDGNGISDNEEKFNQSLSYTESDIDASVKSVEVSFKGTGYINSNTKIVPADTDIYASNLVGIIGKPFSFESTSDFESANISFEIDTDSLGIDTLSGLGIVWYDKDFQQFRLLESSYNDNTDIITAEVPHFSIYCVVNRSKWLEPQTGYYFEALDDRTDLDDDNMPDCYESSNKESPENLFKLSDNTTSFSLIGNKDSDNDGLADGEEIVLCTIGDVDRNGIIEADDTELLQNYIDGSCELSDIERTSADCNCDGKIDKKDTYFLNKYLNNESIPILSGKGDINGDEVIAIADMLILKDFILGESELYPITLENADFNDDKRVDVFDFISIRQLITQGDVSLVGYSYFYCFSDPMDSDTDNDLDLDNADPDKMNYQLNGLFAKNMGRLQKAAKAYYKEKGIKVNDSAFYNQRDNWLAFAFIRSYSNNYNWESISYNNWKQAAGGLLDDEFDRFKNFLNSNSEYSDLYDYFNKTEAIYISNPKKENPESDDLPEEIDLYHMCATLSAYSANGIRKNGAGKDYIDNLCGWSGDFQTLLNSAHEKKGEYDNSIGKAFYNLMGRSDDHFSKDDLYADVASLVINTKLIKDRSVYFENLFNEYFIYSDTKDYVKDFEKNLSLSVIKECTKKYTFLDKKIDRYTCNPTPTNIDDCINAFLKYLNDNYKKEYVMEETYNET